MDRLDGYAEYEWIQSALLKLTPSGEPGWAGVSVGHCLPSGFDRYLKLLHPIYRDLSVIDEKLTWDDVERAERPARRRDMIEEGKRIDSILHPSGAVTRQITPAGSFVGRRVYWRELAERWGRIYHPGITDRGLVPSLSSWPRQLVGPEEGNLEVGQLGILAKALAPLTGEQDCFFWWMTIFREEPMFKGTLVELPNAPVVQEDHRSPNHVWPRDRSWCMCTDYDLCFTLIGGDSRVASVLQAQAELELLEVELTTRVDYRADDRNSSA